MTRRPRYLWNETKPSRQSHQTSQSSGRRTRRLPSVGVGGSKVTKPSCTSHLFERRHSWIRLGVFTMHSAIETRPLDQSRLGKFISFLTTMTKNLVQSQSLFQSVNLRSIIMRLKTFLVSLGSPKCPLWRARGVQSVGRSELEVYTSQAAGTPRLVSRLFFAEFARRTPARLSRRGSSLLPLSLFLHLRKLPSVSSEAPRRNGCLRPVEGFLHFGVGGRGGL